MPRNTSGVYSLPAGNPVVTNTPITTSWANPTMQDLASEITNSLDRSGRGSMLGPFKALAGTTSNPGITFGSETISGFSRPASGQVSLSIAATEVQRWTSAGARFLTAVAIGMAPDAAGRLQITGADENVNLNVFAAAGYHARLSLAGNDTAPGVDAFDLLQDATGAVEIANRANSYMALFTNDTERVRITAAGLVAIGTNAPRGNFDVSDPTTGSSVTTAFHLGYSESDYYGYRLINTNNPASTAAGTFAIQRGNTSAWQNVFSSDNSGNATLHGSAAVGLGIAAGNYVFRLVSATGDRLRAVSNTAGNGITIDITDAGETINDRNLNIGGSSTLSVQGLEVGYKDIPRVTSGAERGKMLATSSNHTVNTLAAGSAYSVYNDSGSSITLSQGSGITLRLGGTTTTGNRTLAARGVATIWFNSTAEAVVTGAGVT